MSTAQHRFDDRGNLTDPLLAERLRAHLTALVAEATPIARRSLIGRELENEEGPREAALLHLR